MSGSLVAPSTVLPLQTGVRWGAVGWGGWGRVRPMSGQTVGTDSYSLVHQYAQEDMPETSQVRSGRVCGLAGSPVGRRAGRQAGSSGLCQSTYLAALMPAVPGLTARDPVVVVAMYTPAALCSLASLCWAGADASKGSEGAACYSTGVPPCPHRTPARARTLLQLASYSTYILPPPRHAPTWIPTCSLVVEPLQM